MAKLKKDYNEYWESEDDMFFSILDELKNKPGWSILMIKRGEVIPFSFLMSKTFKNKITVEKNPDSPTPVSITKLLTYQVNVGVYLDYKKQNNPTFDPKEFPFLSLLIVCDDYGTILKGLKEIENKHE